MVPLNAARNGWATAQQALEQAQLRVIGLEEELNSDSEEIAILKQKLTTAQVLLLVLSVG